MTRDCISIRFPAQKQYALLLRMNIAGALASYDVSVDMLEDLRMAAEEAFDYLLDENAASGEDMLCDICRDENGAVCLHLHLANRAGSPIGQQENELAYAILKTLVNKVTLCADHSGATGVQMMLKAEK